MQMVRGTSGGNLTTGAAGFRSALQRVTDQCRHLREIQAMIDMTALSSSRVVIGKKNLKPGRSMTISPGRRNRGSVLTHGQARPSRIRIAPRPTSKRFIGEVYVPYSRIAIS